MHEICSMDILVIAATEMEIAPFRQHFPNANILITGVGIPASLFSLTKQVFNHSYDCVLQCGVAGSFNDHLMLGSSVLVEKDRYGDLGVWENDHFYSVYDLKLADENAAPMQNGWLINHQIIEFNQDIDKVAAITVNALTDESQHIGLLRSKYHADIETMEGAVLHDLCMREQISFLQIRGISNRMGERDKTKWKLREAIESSNFQLMAIYELLSKK